MLAPAPSLYSLMVAVGSQPLPFPCCKDFNFNESSHILMVIAYSGTPLVPEFCSWKGLSCSLGSGSESTCFLLEGQNTLGMTNTIDSAHRSG